MSAFLNLYALPVQSVAQEQSVTGYGFPRAELEIAWEDPVLIFFFFFFNLANMSYFLVKLRQLSL